MNFKSWMRKKGYLYIFLAPSVIFMGIFTAYPIIYNFIISLQDVNVMTLARPDKEFVGLQNYIEIITNPTFLVVFKNSAIFTLGSVFFQFVIGFALAMFLVKKFPLSNFVRGFIVVGWVIPPVVVGTVWKWLLNTDFGLINYFLSQLHILNTNISWLTNPDMAMIGILIANIWLGIPFNMMLLIGGLTGLPQTVFEAADIDGANWFQKLFFLTIPMLRQTISATLMLGIIYTFKVFALIWVMTGGGPVNATNVLPTWSYQLSFDFFNFSQGAVVANLMFVIMLIFSIIYINYTAGKED